MRVAIVQEYIPLYAASFFERVASQPEMNLEVIADLKTRSALNQVKMCSRSFSAIHVPIWHVGRVRLRPGLRACVMQFRPHLVVIGAHIGSVSELALLLSCRSKQIPVAVWDHFHRLGGASWYWDAYQTLLGRLATASFAYSERGRHEQERRGVKSSQIHVLSTAIDETRMLSLSASLTPECLSKFRREEQLEEKHLILHVARLTKERRADLLLEAFALLCKKRSDVVLALIGDGDCRVALCHQAAQLGVQNAVRFLGASYDEMVAAKWFRAASIFALASGVGLSIHHAMCYGLPVVTGDDIASHGPEIELLRPGYNGLTYRAGSAADFCDKLNLLIDNDGERIRLGTNARHTVASEFTMDRKVRNFLTAIHATVVQHPKGVSVVAS
jgi:glycosyltransferase involved in cell wall biosynthesis